VFQQQPFGVRAQSGMAAAIAALSLNQEQRQSMGIILWDEFF
jgi:hypothetical protein